MFTAIILKPLGFVKQNLLKDFRLMNLAAYQVKVYHNTLGCLNYPV